MSYGWKNVFVIWIEMHVSVVIVVYTWKDECWSDRIVANNLPGSFGVVAGNLP